MGQGPSYLPYYLVDNGTLDKIHICTLANKLRCDLAGRKKKIAEISILRIPYMFNSLLL